VRKFFWLLLHSRTVSDQDYSGRFSLKANLPKARAESMIRGMIGRKILVRYDPERPEVWCISEERIDGYQVGQRPGSRLVYDYSPSDEDSYLAIDLRALTLRRKSRGNPFGINEPWQSAFIAMGGHSPCETQNPCQSLTLATHVTEGAVMLRV
jgi:hypothetical protein